VRCFGTLSSGQPVENLWWDETCDETCDASGGGRSRKTGSLTGDPPRPRLGSVDCDGMGRQRSSGMVSCGQLVMQLPRDPPLRIPQLFTGEIENAPAIDVDSKPGSDTV
jgi:hypothetical protein